MSTGSINNPQITAANYLKAINPLINFAKEMKTNNENKGVLLEQLHEIKVGNNQQTVAEQINSLLTELPVQTLNQLQKIIRSFSKSVDEQIEAKSKLPEKLEMMEKLNAISNSLQNDDVNFETKALMGPSGKFNTAAANFEMTVKLNGEENTYKVGGTFVSNNERFLVDSISLANGQPIQLTTNTENDDDILKLKGTIREEINNLKQLQDSFKQSLSELPKNIIEYKPKFIDIG